MKMSVSPSQGRIDPPRAALSISLAGYNTLMDILATRTPALVYPYMANREQNMRVLPYPWQYRV